MRSCKTDQSFKASSQSRQHSYRQGERQQTLVLGALLTDKAFDANWLLEGFEACSAIAVIPPKSNRKEQRAYNSEVYKWRHMVENYFAKNQEMQMSSYTLRQN